MNGLLRIAPILMAAGLVLADLAHAQVAGAHDELSPRRGIVASDVFFARDAFELVDGDRVVLLGSGFVEAAQEYGYIELALSTRWPDRDVIFRNVGWSGDTVFGDARAHFTNPPGPYERLLDEATAPRPSVLFVGYGSNVPFKEGDALGRFKDGLSRLLDDLEIRTGARIILLSPPPMEADASPVPAAFVRQVNASLEQVADVIERAAEAGGHRYIDVFRGLEAAEQDVDAPITFDGVQLNATGYYHLARIIEEGLGLPPREWAQNDDSAHVRLIDRAERIRRLIIEKNRLYSQQYRPSNETYLVGFRSYEQGQNAKELRRLTPLIEEKEREIGRLKRAAGLSRIFPPAVGR